MQKYIVTLTDDERLSLSSLVSSGKAAAKRITHARILLKADASDGGLAWRDADIALALDAPRATSRATNGIRRGGGAGPSRSGRRLRAGSAVTAGRHRGCGAGLLRLCAWHPQRWAGWPLASAWAAHGLCVG